MIKNSILTILGRKIKVLNLPYTHDDFYGDCYDLHDMMILEDYVRQSKDEIKELDFNIVQEKYKGIGTMDILNKRLSEKDKTMIDLKAAMYTGGNKKRLLKEALEAYADDEDFK